MKIHSQGKSMQDVQKQQTITVLRTKKQLLKHTRMSNYKGVCRIHNNLVFVRKHKTGVCLDKPIYLGKYFC